MDSNSSAAIDTDVLALAAENAASNRHSSASSSSSDLNDHGMPVVPYHDSVALEKPTITHATHSHSQHQYHHAKVPHVAPIAGIGALHISTSASCSESEPPSSVSETSTLEPTTIVSHGGGTGAGGSSLHGGLRLDLQSPSSHAHGTDAQHHQQNKNGSHFTFEEIMSPRHQNGKRYLGGYLNHRVSMAGGFLKTWKRKYFRLRDHGLLCFKLENDTTPLFEIHFKAQSVLLLDRTPGSGSGTPTGATPNPNGTGYDDATTLPPTRGKVNASVLFILKHIEIQGHQTPANKVDVPVYLKAENSTEFHAWVENVRLKMEARKRALMHDSVGRVLGSPSSSSALAPSSYLADAVVKSTSGAAASELPRPRLGSTGESVSFSARNASLPHTDDASIQDRTASMDNLSPSESRAAAASPSANKLLFVAGATPDPPEFATFRAKYLLMKEIGEGSFSIVHRAVNRLTGQLCAVKCCKYSHALDEEVAIMRRLSHPNLVSLEGVYQQDDMYYVVMDYMEDGDLCERLIQKQRFAESEAKQITTQVLRGLEHLHRHHVLHRDIKPENILLHGSVVKIADFGLARQLPSASSMLKRSCGTLEYAAPELLCGQAYGLKSDIFSLGVVLYVLLFGAFPFTIESAAALQKMERFPEGVDVRDMSCLHRDNAQWKNVSSAVQDALLRMLCVNDKERISAKELLTHPWFVSTLSLGTQPVDVDNAAASRDGETMPADSTATQQREDDRIHDCRVKGFQELLTRGLDVTKFGKHGNTSPHTTTIQVDFVRGMLSWTARGGVLGIGGGSSTRKVNDNTGSSASTAATRGARMVSFSDVQEIRVGHTTEAFRSTNSTGGRELPPAELCVSIVATWRTLDLVVKAASQREFVVTGFRRALEEYRSKHK